MTIEIIKADEHHVTEIGELWMEFMRYSQNVDPILTPRDDAIPVFIKDYLRPAMEDKNSLVLIALDGGKAVGYSYSLIIGAGKLEKRPAHGCVHDIFVTDSHRNTGIGKMMFDEIVNWLHSKLVKRVELDVLTQNHVAVSFWEKQGLKDFTRTLYLDI